MAHFTDTSDDELQISRAEVPIGAKTRVRFNGGGPGEAPKTSFLPPGIAELARPPILFDGPRGVWTIDFKGLRAGPTVATSVRDGASATIVLDVFQPPPPVILPKSSTDAGIMARLFLAEAVSPAKSETSAAKAVIVMGWMRIVIANRLRHPRAFGAKGATVRNVVIAKGQFKGFGKYPTIATAQHELIDSILEIAGNTSDPRQRLYNAHAKAAVSAAQGLPGPDPSPNGIVAWRTNGASPPGGNTVFWATEGGIDFYQYQTPPTD